MNNARVRAPILLTVENPNVTLQLVLCTAHSSVTEVLYLRIQPTADRVVPQYVFSEKNLCVKWTHTVQTRVVQTLTVEGADF